MKLLNGEYIALERLESTYKSTKVVSNICVVANAQVRAPIAVVLPHETNLRVALGEAASGKDLGELCLMKETSDLVLREVNKVSACFTQR